MLKRTLFSRFQIAVFLCAATWLIAVGAYAGCSPVVVTSVTPNTGPTAGGTAVTIGGSGFLATTSVTFGGTAATSVVVVNNNTITAVTPAHAAGAVNVVVTNCSGSGTLAN